jgi:hypothetical protein
MSGEVADFSVYGEAKGEYTRQLCVFLVPTLETYMLELLATAKEEAPTPNKILWQFQTVLQGIPDWNQDKVIREAEKIQKDCSCDYLEELITAVFIAHTKVLSAIRLTTKQKKLQITIPKVDHFIHRVLSESARSLWTNAYLFADSSSIEKQKNLRQVSSLLNDSVLQAIRGLLPVKSILREYLHDDDEDGDDKQSSVLEVEEKPEPAVPATEVPVAAEAAEAAEAPVPVEPIPVEAPVPVEPTLVEAPTPVEPTPLAPTPVEPTPVAPTPVEPTPVEAPTALQLPASEPIVNIIKIETKPTVTFSTNHVLFDSENLEENGLQDIPFAEEELPFTQGEEMPVEFDEMLE